MSNADPNLPLWLAFIALAEQATRDPLTNLYNRRYFDETLADHVEIAKRYDRHLSLVLFDIDQFKAINDTHGHIAGDTALRTFAGLLKATARKSDIVCRHGGDEFAVILPETGRDNAKRFVERIMKKQTYPTVSAGIATFPCEDLAQEADAHLLTEKMARKTS